MAYPFIVTHDLAGALYDPNDGDIDPAQLTQALAKAARGHEGKIIRFCPVTGCRRDGDELVIATPQGDIRCRVCGQCRRLPGEEIGRLSGRDVPMMVMSHIICCSTKLPRLPHGAAERARAAAAARRGFVLLSPSGKTGMIRAPMSAIAGAHWATAEDPMPDDFSFQLFPDDLERLEWHLNDAIARVQSAAPACRIHNGPIPYAPDGNPLIRPMPGVPNPFEACVSHSASAGGRGGQGSGRMGHEGATEMEMWS